MELNHTFISLLDFFKKNPRDYTYFAVGSGPTYIDIDKLIPELDQIFPTFLKELINFSNPTIRIVHYDPLFTIKEVIEFLHIYFEKLGFKYDDSDGILCWKSQNNKIEVFVIGEKFDIINEIINIQLMIDHHLYTDTKLVFQEYYGLSNGTVSLVKMHSKFYESTIVELKEIYKKNILFDITYGKAQCMTNMAVERPIFDNYGNFINFYILNSEEKINIIENDKKFEDYYKKIVIRNFIDLINMDHYEFRKSGSNLIMTNLHDKIKPIINILKKLNIVDDEKENYINDLFINYKDINMHKWTSLIKKVIIEKN